VFDGQKELTEEIKHGWVYILTHERMPGLVKIGYTDVSVEERVQSISIATGVQGCFNVVTSYELDYPQRVEALIHKALGRFRFLKNKEFFELKQEAAIEFVSQIIDNCHYGISFDESEMTLIDNVHKIGEIIRRKRKMYGYTQAELAVKCNTSPRLISEVERGKETAEVGKVLHVINVLNIRMAVDNPIIFTSEESDELAT